MESIFKKMVKLSDLPLDSFLAIPKVTLYGNNDLIVENFRGIVEYSDNIVRVNTSIGLMIIKGCGLQLIEITRDDLLIEGEIINIEIKK